MTVLSTIPNGASLKDIRDTINATLTDVALLKAGGGTTPTPSPTLAALTLAAASVTENTAAGTTISGILGKTAGSTLSLANDDGGRFALSSTNLVTGLTNIDYEAGLTRSIVLRETLAGATNSPRDTPLAIGVVNVFEQPSLRALLLSSTSLTIGTPASGSITEAATGSTIAASGLPTGFSINGAARTWAYDGSGPASSSTITLTETLGDSPNSPRATQIGVTVAATTAQPITFTSRQPWDADDGFDGGNAQVNQRPGWTATTASQFKTRNSGMYQEQMYGPRRDASFGPAYGPTDNFEIELDWNYAGDGGGSGFEVSRQDFRWFKTTDDGATGNVFALNPNSVGGNGLGGFMLTSNVDNPAPGTGRTGTGRLRVQAGYIYSKVYGLWCDTQNAFVSPQRTKKTDGIFPISQYNPLPSAGRVGVGMNTWTYNMLNGVRVRALKIHIIDHQRFVGRRAVGVQEGDVTFNGWAASVPAGARWVYRVMDKNNINQVQDFKDMTGVTVSGSDWSATAAIPFGGPYILEVGYIADGIYYSDTSRRVSCGYRWVVYGQSNALGRAQRTSDADSVNRVAGTPAAVSMPEATQWDKNIVFGNETTEFETSITMRAAIQLTQSMGNAPCCIITHGQNATGMAGLVPGSFAWQTLKGMVDAGGGIVDGVTWDQGENDSDTIGAGVTSQNAYYTMFKDTMVPGFRDLAKNPNVPIFLAPVGRYASDGANVNDNVPWASADPQRDAIKQAKIQLVATAGLNVKFSSSKLGVRHGDPYHYSFDDVGTIRNTRRDAFTAAKALGANTADGRGPLITGITRSGATITCDIDLNGAVSLGPDFVTFNTGTVPPAQYRKANDFKGYQVSADNFATLLPVSSIVVSNNKLVITLPSAPSGAVKLRSFYGASFDDTQLIYGTYADGRDPIPIFPVWAPLTSN